MGNSDFNQTEERRQAERRENKERTLVAAQSKIQEDGTGLEQLIRLQRNQRRKA